MTEHQGREGHAAPPDSGGPARSGGVVEEVEVRGHIVNSLLLPKILDRILLMGGTFEIRECKIGVRRSDPSYARIAIQADDHETLGAILGDVVEHGASPVHPEDAKVVPADIAGAFPEEFYSTTSQPTQVRIHGRWADVEDQEMDCGIVVDRESGRLRCIPMCHVELGMPIVVGHAGVRVLPIERSREVSLFGFMNSTVSSEKPKAVSVKGVVDAIRATRAAGKKVLMVGGPAIVHTGSASHAARLIRDGWVQVLFAGNALATHDIEQALYGTSLGVSMSRGEAIEHGHEHHLRAINTIRRLGGIARAVESGVLTSGIMYRVDPGRHRRGPRRFDPRRRPPSRGDHGHPRGPGSDARGDPRRRLRAPDRDGVALDRHGKPVAGKRQGRLRGHQPGDCDQAERPRHVPDDRTGDRRRALLAIVGRGADIGRGVNSGGIAHLIDSPWTTRARPGS